MAAALGSRAMVKGTPVTLPRMRASLKVRAVVAPRRMAVRAAAAPEQAPPEEAPVEEEATLPPGALLVRNLDRAKPFHIDSDQAMDIIGAAVPFATRLGTGAFAHGYRIGLVEDDPSRYSVARFQGQMVQETSKIEHLKRPEQRLELYEFEACPFCKKVREAINILDLDVVFYPCPKDGPVFREEAIAEGGKKMFPYLKDPNTNTAMYESDDIVKYLFNTYGDGDVPLALNMGLMTAVSSGVGLLGRTGRGATYRAAKMPETPLEFWGYDISPFCKVVRETLVELEIPHVFISTARGSPKRQELFEKTGTFQVPYLEDPNTGVALFESADIIRYLEETYAVDKEEKLW